MFIRGTDPAGVDFLDLTKTLDFSSTGAYIASPRLLHVDQILSLTIPAPSLTATSLLAETPPIQARVKRRCDFAGIHLLAVEFAKALD
jgi:hypothetical protein